ncbi:PQQ-binding-like beta-propeller repeat protein [Acaricomes phytoseiuli]|uniref:DUF7927 domain-containing protein n=1 Tax=Acaricomes phytoseiuli TaxID=291968 RepID=UPI00036A009C|nr:PQQ-binding-like beta-propeller repeat protein [Acaricomes phytoseiuli]MCW1248959.1 PQQ-binding-like beta-propeller repeat protein [Acaricomes phytoseiuli]
MAQAAPEQAAPEQASTGERYPLAKTVNIDGNALYGASGGSIIKIDLRTGAQQEVVASRQPNRTWATNLGVGPDVSTPGKLAFYSSAYRGSDKTSVFRVKDQSNYIENTGDARQVSRAWGGGAVSADGMYWQGTNLLTTGKTQISRYNPVTKRTEISGNLRAPSSDRVWNSWKGKVAPDYTFDDQGNLYALVSYWFSTYLYKFDVENFSENAVVPVSRVTEVKGLPKLAKRYYGLAWNNGNWYTGQSNGNIYRINSSGTASYFTKMMRPSVKGSYLLEDLASSPGPGPEPAKIDVVKESSIPAGSIVGTGMRIDYTLRYTNTGGSAGSVNEFDDMSDALDDTTLAARPVSSDSALAASQVDSSGRFTIRGTLQPGQTVTVRYAVTVKPEGQRGNDLVVNFVLQDGTAVPPRCTAELSSRCIETRVGKAING